MGDEGCSLKFRRNPVEEALIDSEAGSSSPLLLGEDKGLEHKGLIPAGLSVLYTSGGDSITQPKWLGCACLGLKQRSVSFLDQ